MPLSLYQEKFIESLVKTGALTFGDFTLKSGRKSPYFINLEKLCDGESLSILARIYAEAIIKQFCDGDKNKLENNIIFGPAYKGIPLAVTITLFFYFEHGIKVKFFSNRKESKNYGEKSDSLGAEINDGDKVIIIDDVLSTGGTKEGAVEFLRQIGKKIELKGVLVAVNRLETDQENQNPTEEFEKKYQLPIESITDIWEIINYLHNREIESKIWVDDEIKKRIEIYLFQYGVGEIKKEIQNKYCKEKEIESVKKI